MNKKLPFLLACLTVSIWAGQHDSKHTGYQKIPQGNPFDGKKWDSVCIEDDGSIYTYRKKGIVEEWDFEGEIKKRTIPTVSNATMQLIGKHLILWHNNKAQAITPSNVSKKITCKETIRTMGITPQGKIMLLTSDGFIEQYNGSFKTIKAQTVDIKQTEWCRPFDNGIAYVEKLSVPTQHLCIVDYESPTIVKVPTATGKSQKLFPKKIPPHHALIYQDHPQDPTRSELFIYDLQKNEPTSFAIDGHPEALDLDPSFLHVATASLNEHKDKLTFRIFDINTGKKIHSKPLKSDVKGSCDFRLKENDAIYFIGNKPSPCSLTIDMREK